jgi:hypothetical protein
MPPIDVLTRSYTNTRTGVNLREVVLTKANVNVNQFGKLFTRTVDGQIYAQPLIVTNVAINGQVVPEVVIVATTRNIVYAFDAKDPARCDYLWRTRPAQLGTPTSRTDYQQVPPFHTVAGAADTPAKTKVYRDFTEEVGVTSTPVIDDTRTFLYVVAKSKAGANFFNKLHKLKLATGEDAPGSPVLIEGSVPGTGFRPLGGPAGAVAFNQQWQLNRPGLLLAEGNLYIAFGSQGDDGPYHGWVFAYDAKTLKPKAMHCTTPDWGEGGIWQSGGGLAYADGHVYYVAGNGPKGGTVGVDGATVNREPTDAELRGGSSFGNTVVKLKADTLEVADWFSPTNTRALSQDDMDLCAGPVLPDRTDLVLGFGKDGFIYSCDRNAMGGWDPRASRNLQSQKITAWNIHGTPLYWQPKNLLFLWSEQDACLGYRLNGRTFAFVPGAFSRFRFTLGVNSMPGGMLALSANGDRDGIVWAAHPTDKNANQATVAGTLRALDADNLQNELWNSDHDPQGSDAVGNFAKFCPPVVANGKVYVATFSSALAVYGLLGDVAPMPLGHWSQASVGTGVLGSASESCDRFTVLGAGSDIWDPADAFHFVYQKVGAGAPVTLTALVTGMHDTDPWAKAGVMIRDTLDPRSPHAMVVMTPGKGVAFQHRDAQGGASSNTNLAEITTPHWVRVRRDPVAGRPGQFLLSGFHSSDGVAWQPLGQPVQVGMGGDALAGMAVTSHTVTTDDPNSLVGIEELNVATFERVDLE